MLAVKENYRGNVVNQKTDDNKWYLDFIRNPNISPNAKIVFLNLRTNGDSYNENIKSLMFKCNLSERLISKAIKELEDLKVLTREVKRQSGKFQYLYFTTVENLPSPLYRGTVNRGAETVPYKYNKNINKTNDDYLLYHHEVSDLENVENSLIEFADKSDIKKTNDFFDEIIFNSGIFNFILEDKQIKSFKLKIVPKALKENKLNPVLETIKLFPSYVKKTNEGINPKGKFTEYEMLTYLGTILLSDCKYPKWFNDLSKQEIVQKQVNNLEDSWKPITNIWNCHGSRIDDSIKLMISNILDFIQDLEYHKRNNLEYKNTRQLEFFAQATQKTLKIKSVDEIVNLINEYSLKKWNSLDLFKKSLNNFFDYGLTLETIKTSLLSFAGAN